MGCSGSGKTTLVSRVIERLSAEGLRIGALKHDAHEFQMDREGDDAPKIEVHRRGRPLQALEGHLTNVIAVVSDDPEVRWTPRFSPDDLEGVIRLLRAALEFPASPSSPPSPPSPRR